MGKFRVFPRGKIRIALNNVFIKRYQFWSRIISFL